jgi:hypothetical protein
MGEGRKAIFVGTIYGEKIFGRLRLRWNDNIKIVPEVL